MTNSPPWKPEAARYASQPMTPTGHAILENLRAVEDHRALRAADGALSARVTSLKAYQQARFARTYSDLLESQRYTKATRFFLDKLYGPGDFAQRDREFARIVPALVRLFPQPIVETVEALSALHALSEALDTSMARSFSDLPLSASRYAQAWQTVGQAAQRERQIELTMAVGHALERYTRNAMLRHSLRLMRAPARQADLGELQTFLERGFEAFAAMRGATAFLSTIESREHALAARLFAADIDVDPFSDLP